jgi:hypothetical protein
LIARRLWAVLAAVVVASMSGCQSDHKAAEYALSPGQSWSEQREQARSVLAAYAEQVSRPGQSPRPAITASGPVAPGPAILSAVVEPGGSRMVVSFTGARGPASEPCGVDYSADVVESDKAVVIILLTQRHAFNEECTLEGTDRSATLNLARPLAGRAVLDLQQTQPIPVSTGPVRSRT